MVVDLAQHPLQKHKYNPYANGPLCILSKACWSAGFNRFDALCLDELGLAVAGRPALQPERFHSEASEGPPGRARRPGPATAALADADILLPCLCAV